MTKNEKPECGRTSNSNPYEEGLESNPCEV